MDIELMDAHEKALRASVDCLFIALRNQKLSKSKKIREVLDFHFDMQDHTKEFLEDLGMIER